MKGYGISANPEKALELCKAVLEKGCAEANFYMGLFTESGMADITHDNVKALEYYELATESEEIEIDNGYEDVDKVRGYIQKMVDDGHITQEDASKWL